MTILELILISALCGFAFQKFQEQQMIFRWYWRILKNLTKKGPLWAKIAKPLGLCIVCNTTWIGFIVGFIFKMDWISVLIIGVAAPTVAILINNVHQYLVAQTFDEE